MCSVFYFYAYVLKVFIYTCAGAHALTSIRNNAQKCNNLLSFKFC